MLLPLMLINFCSWVIPSVGNETLITSPPRKNGFTSWRWGDIISIRQVSLARGGMVMRSRFSRNSTASRASSRIRAGCLPGSTYLVLTSSRAFFQSSPNPRSRAARLISTSHQASSFSAMAASSSGE